MSNENSPDIVAQDPVLTTLLLDFSSWASDPAVLTAIASLLTALAAFFKVRHRRNADPHAPNQTQQHVAPVSRAYETLHAVEERIREELLLQLQTLQEEAELVGQDLAAYEEANAALKAMIAGCNQPDCPIRNPSVG